MAFSTHNVKVQPWDLRLAPLSLTSSWNTLKIWPCLLSRQHLSFTADTSTIQWSFFKRSEVDDFTEHLNSIHPAIKFTVKYEQNNQIAMLDTLIHKNADGRLSFSVYRKNTHTDQYLHFNSHQPLQHKLGVIRTLKHRAKTIFSNTDILDKELNHIQGALSVCGYTKAIWNTSASEKISPKPRTKDYTTPVGSITILYVQGVTEGLSRIIRKAGVTVHTKPTNTIRSMLVAPKNKPNKGDRS